MQKKRDPAASKGASNKEFGWRLLVVGLIFLSLLSLIVVRLLSVQIVDVQKYKKMATRQHEREMSVQAKRGRMLDRSGRCLAESVQMISFYADPYLVRNTPRRSNGKRDTVNRVPEVSALFARHFGKSRYHYRRKLQKKNRFVWMERSVPIARAQKLMEKAVTGVGYEKEQQRYYLNIASQLIGLTDRDNQGISGLEKKYHEELKGHDGIKVFQRNATGERFIDADEKQIPAREGMSLQLTIDADIQSIVEDELQKAAGRFDAAAATGIVMNVRTGEVLAMASYPSFNMNNRRGYRPEKARNRAITDAFEPGSTIKIVMAAAATEVLHRQAGDSLNAHNGTLVVHRRVIRDHEKFDRLTFRDAMVHSSNVVAAKTAMALGPETYYRYIKRFGFGERTGIDLLGESKGLLKKPDKWDRTTLPWMGYGYAFTATPLQVLQAYAAVANGGMMMRPYVVKSIVDRDGAVVRQTSPKSVRQVVNPETARYMIKEYLEPIVSEGTGSLAALPAIAVAGKTGTAQKLKNGSYHRGDYVASFAGMFPADKPEIAAIVVVDEPKTEYYASSVAAPVFAAISKRMIAISEPLKHKLALVSPRQRELDSLSQISVPQLVGLPGKEARKLLEWSELVMEYRGSLEDVVTAQATASGSMVDAGSVVQVTLGAAEVRHGDQVSTIQ